MAERIRFHLDENVAPAIAEGLRRWRIDVTTSQEAGLLHRNDEVQLAFAIAQGRVLVTHDTHFFTLAAARPEHPGIVFSEMHALSIGQMVRGLKHICDTWTAEDMAGQIEYL